MSVRQAAHAGSFYPGDAGELTSMVDNLLRNANAPAGPAPKAIIAPHAGYIYSGSNAASIYRQLEAGRGTIGRVVLLGPSHRVAFRGIAACASDAYETPLGQVRIDQEAIGKILPLPNVGYLDDAHLQEHSLEVHLPFLQRMLGDFSLVPLVVGDASPDDVARVLETLWLGPETLIVISTDLSHFHDYNEAVQLDSRTAQKILALEPTLTGEEACGCRPVNGLLQLARQRGLQLEQVTINNSGDTAGDRNRVVGYGSFRLMEHNEPTLKLAYRQQLLQVARDAIAAPLGNNPNYNIDLARYPAALAEKRATFVTLNLNGQLRGCIGSLIATRQLIVDVANNAQSAAFKDHRFKPLTLAEFQEVDIHISVLSPPSQLAVDSRETLIANLRPGIDGLILEENGHRATYLPSVWSQLPDPETFVSELRRKAGLPATGWSPATTVHRYTTEEFA